MVSLRDEGTTFPILFSLFVDLSYWIETITQVSLLRCTWKTIQWVKNIAQEHPLDENIYCRYRYARENISQGNHAYPWSPYVNRLFESNKRIINRLTVQDRPTSVSDEKFAIKRQHSTSKFYNSMTTPSRVCGIDAKNLIRFCGRTSGIVMARQFANEILKVTNNRVRLNTRLALNWAARCQSSPLFSNRCANSLARWRGVGSMRAISLP